MADTEYTPTTNYVRESYAREKHPDSPGLIDMRRQGFDRWLDGERKRILNDAADRIQGFGGAYAIKYLRAAANGETE